MRLLAGKGPTERFGQIQRLITVVACVSMLAGGIAHASGEEKMPAPRFASFLARSIVRPVKLISLALGDLAAGDLTISSITPDEARRVMERGDEIGDLGQNLRKMRLTLDSVVESIRAASSQVSSGAQQLSTMSESLSQGSNEQAASIEELSASVEELASGRVQSSRIRPVEVQDLLGREKVELETENIRLALQDEDGGKLGGEVEVDETFIGGRARNMHIRKRREKIMGTGGRDKVAVLGILKRKGKIPSSVRCSITLLRRRDCFCRCLGFRESSCPR